MYEDIINYWGCRLLTIVLECFECLPVGNEGKYKSDERETTAKNDNETEDTILIKVGRKPGWYAVG